jgi:predicted nucleotidyltransferase
MMVTRMGGILFMPAAQTNADGTNVVLEGIVGSTAYGLATENSDIDKLGIYVEPTINFSGLDLFTDKDFSKVTTEPDRTLHELGKYCRLALRCNPTVLELLWLPEELLTTMSEEGRQLRARREWFLDPVLVRNAYMGYATSQFKRLSDRGFTDFGSDLRNRTKKHARHLLRLMHQGYTLYTIGTLPIVLENPEMYFEFGEMVAFHPGHANRVIKDYESKFDNAKTVLRPSDPKPVDIWLKSIRKKF